MKILLSPWSAVLACAALSTIADTLGTVWWEQKKLWVLLAMIGLAPLVFLAFGYVGSHFGLAKASSLTATSPGPRADPASHFFTFLLSHVLPSSVHIHEQPPSASSAPLR